MNSLKNIGMMMGRMITRKFRNFNDFKWGSFQVYVTEKEIIIRGILKKTDNFSPYILIRENDLK